MSIGLILVIILIIFLLGGFSGRFGGYGYGYGHGGVGIIGIIVIHSRRPAADGKTLIDRRGCGVSRLRAQPESHLVGRIDGLRAAVLGANDGIDSI